MAYRPGRPRPEIETEVCQWFKLANALTLPGPPPGPARGEQDSDRAKKVGLVDTPGRVGSGAS